MTGQITVIVPTLPGRTPLYQRAIRSVYAQTMRPEHLLVATDRDGVGAAAIRDQLLAQVTTEWVAPLDDDDEYKPGHLAGLAAAVEDAGADLAYAWYEIVGPGGAVEQWRDPHVRFEGVLWDPGHPHQVPTTFLARTEVLRAVGGWTDFGRWHPSTAALDDHGHRVGEDTLLIGRLNSIGARIVHHPARSYRWHHHLECGGNTSGWTGLNR